MALSINSDRAIECEDCETSEAKIDHFQRDIRLRGQLTEEHIASLLAIADKCPVHRTLEQRSHISTARVD